MNQAQKRKKKSAALAVVLAAALALTGTFAWQSISQVARNEAKSSVNPGGRLHDDFSGYNVLGTNVVSGKYKRIYVENFTDPDNGGIPIFARVKLTEYMELGKGAGDMNDDGTRADTNKAKPLVDGKSIDNPSQWTPYVPGKADDPFREYWELNTGGGCRYMPTFNKNKDSLAADINGTLAGTDGDPDTGTPYDDFKNHWSDNITADAYYDADDNDVDEDPTQPGNGGTENTNYTKASETHKAKATLTAQVMTMDEWIASGANAGEYWVCDSDGWAYWAQAIEPGTATGCLLNDVTMTGSVDEDWYYSINAVGQFATAFDWGSQADNSGFYKDGETISANGLMVLNAAAGADYAVVKSGETEAVTYMDKGESADLKLYIKQSRETYDSVKWSIAAEDKDKLQAGTTLTEAGKLTIDANEKYETKFTVNACAASSGKVLASTEIVVETDELNRIRSIAAGSTGTVNIDGVDWYVVARDDTSSGDSTGVLLLSKEITERRVFSGSNDNAWESSNVRTYLNGQYLNDKDVLTEVVKETSIFTRKKFASEGIEEFTETQDKVFLLSEADFIGHLTGSDQTGATLQAKDYTYNGEKLAEEGKPLVTLKAAKCNVFEKGEHGTDYYYTTRSPLQKYNSVTSQIYVTNPTEAVYHTYSGKALSIRPAMWITLTN